MVRKHIVRTILRWQHRRMRRKARTDDSGDERGIWDSMKEKYRYTDNFIKYFK